MTRSALCSGLASLLVASSSLALPESDVDELFAYACEQMQVDCAGEYIPEVAYAPLAWMYGGILGTYRYQAPGYVWLDISFMESTTNAWYHKGTALHEMVHLIDFEMRGITDVCESEANAWRIENAWFTANNKYHLAQWNWRENYPHCQLGLNDDTE